MSDPNCAMRINLYNKKLYDFLERYARKGLFQKDKLRVLLCPEDTEYPVENLSDIGKKEWNENDGIFIKDLYGDYVGHVPEGIYDVIPCFLIYLAWLIKWEKDTFLEFKESLLQEQSEIVTGFDKVIWEEVQIEHRVYWDGVYYWTAKFNYDRSSDTSEYTNTIHKFGLEAPKFLAEDDWSEKEIYEEAIKEQSKYYDYDWDALCKKIFPCNLPHVLLSDLNGKDLSFSSEDEDFIDEGFIEEDFIDEFDDEFDDD